MAILQAQNEKIALKKKQAKQKEKARRSRPKNRKKGGSLWKRKGGKTRCVGGVELRVWVMSSSFLFHGDFNNIIQEEERRGATSLPRGQSCSRVDRFLVSLEWLEEFPERGPRGLSDHCPLIMTVTRCLGDIQFMDKLKALTIPLGRWHREHFGDEIRKVDDLVSNGVYDGIMEARRKALVCSCKKWYIRKELHWKHMSRSRHAMEMDKNTRYFHNLASARRRNNRIEALKIQGRLVRNQSRIKVAIRDFYKELYHQEQSPNIGFRDGLVRRINEDEATELELMSNADKIKSAVWDCESSKAPGSDGYNMNFIKKCWEEVGQEFTDAVMGFFHSALLPADSNVTWVALAPKFTGATEIRSYPRCWFGGCEK
ncbi:uncharacterized protein LOC130939294 [Arachis stenosperma]|uniref:uncharacterized protein LOC130939294 n=1 Tax=Arachis stenosperma TaxID=217475 RepID=UPI0025AD0BB8|nr:uncharacterized protein LOC130939294 [Arachis stenosperma]